VPSKGKLVEMQRKLEDDLAKLTKRVQAQVDCLPVDVAVNGVILFELTELAAMDDLRKGQKSSRSALFAESWEEVGVTKRSIQPGMTVGDDLQPRLLQPMESALADLRRWQDRFTEHEQRLQRLAKYLATGRLSAAKVSGRKLGQLRFAELNYQPLTDLKTLESALKELERAKPGKATRLIKELRAKHSKAGAHTELIQLLNRHQARAASKKRQVLILALLMLGLITFAGKFVGGGLREAEDERLAFERIVDQAKARLSKDVQSGAIDGKLEIPLSASVSAQFCFIPSGSFTMGSPSGEEGRSRDEGQVEVTLSQLFWLAKTEVTQAQWEAVMGSNPSYFKGNQLPVENVSWEEAQAFIAKLNKMQMLPQGWRFALPTEAQWEYACRAGEKGPYSGGSLDQLGWYDGNSGRKSHEVGQKHPNAWGLYDMHGNVLEWCVDRYADTLQGGEDPRGPELGVSRVCRGGCWSFYASSCRAALRLRNYPGNRFSSLGFRPALVPSE
jgi:formylglycine-generating enzyme required for sulfatase activity